MLDSIGIKISVSEIPEYVEYARLRDRLELMHPIRRWLSFRLRRELEDARFMATGALLAATLAIGDRLIREADNALD